MFPLQKFEEIEQWIEEFKNHLMKNNTNYEIKLKTLEVENCKIETYG